jgi:hypothetical protein
MLSAHHAGNLYRKDALSASCWKPCSPLWQRAPSQHTDGTPLADLMMLIPGLKYYSELHFTHVQALLDSVVKEFGDKVVFADINLKLNVVWVTVLPEPGLCREVALAIRDRIPEAVMVGNQLKSINTELHVHGWRDWTRHLRRLLFKQKDVRIPQAATGSQLLDDQRSAD